MNFYFGAVGDKDTVLSQLKNADTRGIGLCERIRDAIADAVESEPEHTGQYYKGSYSISVNGHAGDASVPLTLSVIVQSRYVPKVMPLWP